MVKMFSNYQISMDRQVFRLFGSVLSTPDSYRFDCCHCPKPEASGIFLRLGLSAINVLDASDEVVDT